MKADRATAPAASALSDWRAQVDKELSGRSFEKTLVHTTIEGLSIEPLYVQGPPGRRAFRTAPSFRVCARVEPEAPWQDVEAEIRAGADAVWMGLADLPAGGLAAAATYGTMLVLEARGDVAPVYAVERLVVETAAVEPAPLAIAFDPLARQVRSAAATLEVDLAALGTLGRVVSGGLPGATAAMVSTLPYHAAGADAADEIALALSAGVLYIETLREAGLPADPAARLIALQIAVGRDTFLELCKLRAIRTCWQRLLAAAGAGGDTRTLLHAVASPRTVTGRDPWVNLLRATTQLFAGILGGADLVTATAFDDALGVSSALGRRAARNTGLILRDESLLGRVADPAGGSYYLETLTDALAREAWNRFRAIEREGGMAPLLSSGRLQQRLEKTWRERLDAIAKRKTGIVGVSEFADLNEALPEHVVTRPAPAASEGLPVHRDAEAFEALRAQAEAKSRPPEALLSTVGTAEGARARVAFAAGFFAAGGIRTKTTATVEKAAVACLCGTDEAYAESAAARARELKAAGCSRVLLAGRPGSMEAGLRAAGVDAFIYLGCDGVAALADVLEVFS